MKMLLDSCVWGGLCNALILNGHDAVWVGNWENDPGDQDILAFANHEKRILITLDKDFGELAVLYGHKHSGILRMVNLSLSRQATICKTIIEKYNKELLSGAIITVDSKKIRIRLSKK